MEVKLKEALQETELLRHSEMVSRNLIRGVLSGGGLASVTAFISEQVGCRVAVLDPRLRLLASSPGLDHGTLSAWLEAKNPTPYPHAERAGARVELIGPQSSTAVSLLVSADAEVLGQLLLWPLRLPLTNRTDIVIDHALAVIAMELVKQREIKRVEDRYYNDALADLLQGRITSMADLQQRVRHLDWDLNARYHVLAFELPDVQRMGRQQSLLEAALDGVVRTVEELNPRPIVGLVQSQIVLLLPESKPVRVRSALEGIARGIQLRIAHATRAAKPTVGMCQSSATLLTLKQPYEEARDAAKLASLIWGAGLITFWDQLGIYRLLRDCPPLVREEFVQAVIGPMLEHAEQRNGDVLMETLETYVEAQGRVRATADRLRVHVNTVKYRLNQIEELTGYSPETPAGIASLVIALKLMDLLGKRKQRK